MEKPRLEADSWSFDEDEPDIKHEHVCSIANFSKEMKMPRCNGQCWENSGAGEVSGRSPSASHDAVYTYVVELSPAALGPLTAGEVQLPHLLGECAIEVYSYSTLALHYTTSSRIVLASLEVSSYLAL